MAVLLTRYLPSRTTALYASGIILPVLALLLTGSVLMTLARLEAVGPYWLTFVEVSLVLLTAQWWVTVTWVQACTHQGPWSLETLRRPMAWLSIAVLLQVGAVRLVIHRMIPQLEALTVQATDRTAEGAAFITLCGGFLVWLITISLVIAHLCYLCLRHRRAIG